MATLVESPLSLDVPKPIDITQLPFKLDLSCPINLPSKPLSAGTGWSFNIAGPSRIPDEELDAFISRRYHETLYLPEPGFSTPGDVGGQADIFKPLLLSLPQIEKKHRRTVLPILSTTGFSTSSSKAGDAELSVQEKSVIRFSLDLRVGSRLAAEDGVIPVPKKIADEFEKREILIQVILLLMYITTLTPSTGDQKSKKRKRRSHSHRHEPEVTEIVSPTEDPKTALELLIDRLSVWQAVADIGLDLALNAPDAKSTGAGGGSGGTASNQGKKGRKGDDAAGVGALLGKFWKSVILPFFVSFQPELCSTFHIKVFGHPIPSKLVPPPTLAGIGPVPGFSTKKPRKPKVTRPMPSKDDLLLPPPPVFDRDRPRSTSYDKQKEYERERAMSRTSSRAGSRAPSEAGSRASPPPPTSGSGVNMRRSLSKTSDSQSQSQIQTPSASLLRRSRSRSIDPIARSESLSSVRNIGNASKKSLMRAPSGKDLFKSREVGLMRRTTSTTATTLTRKDSSILSREESQSQLHSQSQSQSQSGGRFGLLGRKTSGGRETQRKSSGDESQNPSTLILATPSKPRHTHAFFGARTQSQPHFQPPQSHSQQYQYQTQGWSQHMQTPGRERDGGITSSSSSTSRSRPSFIAETPANPSRIAKRNAFPLDELRSGDVVMDEADDGDGSDVSLGELWENTDDEGDDGDEGGYGMSSGNRGITVVPETPMK
ncbi:hypothetical protein IAT40_002785 [Kwoniella sp. CBS 6097]